MNINFTHLSSNLKTNQNQSAKPMWSAGDTINATLLSRTQDTATLQTADGFTFTASGKQVQGEVGDSLTFKVYKAHDNIRLKQLHTNDFHASMQRERGKTELADFIGEVKEMTRTVEQIGEEDTERVEEKIETNEQTAKAIARIRRAQSYLSANVGRAAVAALIESGVSLTKISFDMFNHVMHHAEKRPQSEFNPEELNMAKVRPDGETIIESLHRYGLPVHEKNIEALENSWAHTPYQIKAPAAERLIDLNQPLTIENAYKATHSARPNLTPLNDWEAPDDMLIKLFKQEKITDSEENIKAARFLIARDLPADAENIEKVVFLQHFRASKEYLYDRAAACIAQDKPMADITLREIADTADARFLAETRLKISNEAAARHQNLRIDTVTLREDVRTLTQRDEANLVSYLRMASAEDIPANVSRMKAVFNTLNDIHPLTVNTHIGILGGQTSFTIQGVHEQVLFARAQAGYEQFATIPSVRHGDSFTKVRSQFTPLLESMNITATSENLKAAFILSKNSMDVNGENLLSIKEIDAKINFVANNLHPIIAAHMLKDGLQPLEMHVDQVLTYIKRFNMDMGEDGSEKIARYIMEMDNSGHTDSDTRKSMIAVYRMLHVIQKDGAAALGLALRQNPEASLTMGNLMELSKYYQSQRKAGTVFDHTVDDAFGHLERMIRPAESIRAALETAKPINYTDILAERFIDHASPEALAIFIKQEAETPLEELLYREAAKPAGSTAMERMQAFIAAQPALLYHLQKQNISPTLANIKAASALSGSKRALPEALEAAKIDLESLMDTSLTPLREGETPASVMAKAWASLGDPSTPAIEAAGALIALQNGLNNDKSFTVPININGRISDLSLYVLNEKALDEDGARIFLKLDTATLGEVRGFFTLNSGKLDITFTAETESAAQSLETWKDMLAAGLEESGIKMGECKVMLAESDKQNGLPERPAELPPTADSAHEYKI